MSDQKPTISVFDNWMADWISNNPPADRYSNKNQFTTIEIMHVYFLDTMDEGITQEEVQKALLNAEYIFEGGSWLTL